MLLLLVPVLLGALVTPGPGNRLHWRRRRDYPWAGFTAPVVVAAASLIVPAPVMLVVDLDRELTALDLAAVALSPVVAFGAARWVSPPWWKSSHRWIAARALLLVALVAAAEVRTGGTASLSRAWLVSAIVTAGYLACWRVLDTGYWPMLLIRDGMVLLVVAGGALLFQASGGALLFQASGGALFSRESGGAALLPAHGGELVELASTLLITVLAAAGLVAVLTGGWRLRRWLRAGPPVWPRPPGLASWPPEPGEVWNASIVHGDDGHRDRPVVVWSREANYATVLTVTPVEESAHPGPHLRLPLAEWHRVLTGDSWLSLELTPVPYTDFRSLWGRCPERFWTRIDNRRIRAPRSYTPSLTRRHRFRSAMNRRVTTPRR